jgi:D-glycero-alpha-D-manno-heptose-7-phosphate kinase
VVLVFIGFKRKANLITKRQVERIKTKENYLYLNKIQEITKNAYVEIFNQKKLDLRKFADAFNEQWDIKKNLTNNVTNKNLDNIYSEAIKNGALGGKLLGAGGGGFFLFIVDDKNLIPELRKKARETYLKDRENI